MRKILCSRLCLSYLERYWWGGTNFLLPWSRYIIWWRGVCRIKGYRGRVVCLVLVCVCLWFWCQVSVPWCDRPILLPHAWVYCGGYIVSRWVSRFVWWFGWPILVPFVCLRCEWNTFVVYVKGVYEWNPKSYTASRFKGCLSVEFYLGILSGHFFLLQFIKVRRLK